MAVLISALLYIYNVVYFEFYYRFSLIMALLFFDKSVIKTIYHKNRKKTDKKAITL